MSEWIGKDIRWQPTGKPGSEWWDGVVVAENGKYIRVKASHGRKHRILWVRKDQVTMYGKP